MHFSNGSKYDYFKYNGKTRVSESSFLGRKDKYFFERLAKKCQSKEQALYLIWANVLVSENDSNVYIRNISDVPYNVLLSLSDAFDYKFKQWLETVINQDTKKLTFSHIRDTIFTDKELKPSYLFFLVLLNEFVYNKKLEEHCNKSSHPFNTELGLKLRKHGDFCKNWMLSRNPEFQVYIRELVSTYLI